LLTNAVFFPWNFYSQQLQSYLCCIHLQNIQDNCDSMHQKAFVRSVRFLEPNAKLRSRVIRAGCIDYVTIFHNNLYTHPEEYSKKLHKWMSHKWAYISWDGNNARARFVSIVHADCFCAAVLCNWDKNDYSCKQ